MGAHDFKHNMVSLFARKPMNINASMSVCYSRKPLLLRCKLVIPQCLCKVSSGLKNVQKGAHDFKLNKVPLFARKPENINTSMSAAPKPALVPAGCYYCDVNWSYNNVCGKFH